MMVPARQFCEICNLRAVEGYYDLPDTGTIETFTASNVDWASGPLPEGTVDLFAVIAIDGATEQMGIVHKLGEVDPEDVHIGQRVKAVWKPEGEREGSVTDILYFRPLAGDEPVEAIPRPIKPEELTAVTAQSHPGRIPLDYAYTAGLAGGSFYEALAEGKLVASRCADCNCAVLPPTSFCQESMTALDMDKDLIELDPKSGIVVSYTKVFEGRKGQLLDEPVFVAQVEFGGASGSLIGKLVDVFGQRRRGRHGRRARADRPGRPGAPGLPSSELGSTQEFAPRADSCRSLVGARTDHHRRDGLEQHLEVEREALVPQVDLVEEHLLLEGQVAAAHDLPEAGHPRLRREPHHVRLRRSRRPLRPGADEGRRETSCPTGHGRTAAARRGSSCG